MPERRPKDPAPDLFEAVAKKAPPPRQQEAVPQEPSGSSAPRRYMLPHDLAGALTRLDDGEVDALLVAVSEEARRRGRLPPKQSETRSRNFGERRPKSEKAERMPEQAQFVRSRPSRATASGGAPPLTIGKANAVRAAFMAGVKPSAIARQFGISQAAVRQVLAGDTPGEKP